MNPKRPGLHRFMICITGLVLFIVLPNCSNGNGPSSTASPAAHASPKPTPTIPTCNPMCATILTQPGIAFIGQVLSINQQASSSTIGSGALSVKASQYTLLVSLPEGSSPPKNQLTLVVNTQLTLTKGDFIKVVATPNNDANHTFTAQQPIEKVTQQDFQSQMIEYQGEEITPASCAGGDCAISFSLGGLTFSFRLNSQTNIQGFGTPPMIMANQTVDVIVLFVQGTPPSVLQVTNLSPLSPTQTITSTSSSCIQVDQSSLQFAGVAGKSDPTAQTVTLTNCGDTGTWSGSPVTTGTPVTNGGVNWLSISPMGGPLNNGATQPVTVTASNLEASLAAGTYTETITFTIQTSTGSNSANVNVTLNVSSGPAMQLSPNSLTFGPLGCSTSQSQSISVTNGGGGTLTWSVDTSSQPSWLTSTPTNGSAPGTVTFTANSTGLSNTTYNATVNITGSDGTNQPVTVTLIVQCVT